MRMKPAFLIVFVVGLVIQVHGKTINQNQYMYYFLFVLISGVISSPLWMHMKSENQVEKEKVR